jgi:hypothetical protein
MNKIIFKHYGDMGDIIFSLPVLRYFKNQGNFVDLELDCNGGKGKMAPYRAVPARGFTKFNETAYKFLLPLLEKQSYIGLIRNQVTEIIQPGVEYIDLNLFRNAIGVNNLVLSHLAATNVIKDKEGMESFPKLTERWLEVGENNEEKFDIILNRTLRSQGNHAFWEKFVPDRIKDGSKIGFIGTDLEYQVIQEVTESKIPRILITDALQMARLIDKCDHFVSNEGLPGAIAMGLDKQLVLEVNKTYPAIVFRHKTEEGKHQYI